MTNKVGIAQTICGVCSWDQDSIQNKYIKNDP